MFVFVLIETFLNRKYKQFFIYLSFDDVPTPISKNVDKHAKLKVQKYFVRDFKLDKG